MSIKSWHDSDEIDSEAECEAYNMLYFNAENKIAPQDNESKFVDLTRNLLIESDIETDEKCTDGIILISDSDESVIEKKLICTNKVSSLYIGCNSDDSDASDFENINKKVPEISDSSFMFNISVNGHETRKITNIVNVDEKSDSVEIPDWSVDNADTQPKSKFRSRYFDANDSEICYICSKKGHSTLDCNRSGPVCILCGREGHKSNDCDDIICHICFQTNHLTKKCPNSSNFLRSCCKRCGQRGHNEQICPDIWRQYKYTLQQGSPVVQRCSSQNKNNVFCANCSRIGHFTDQCARNRMTSRFLGPPPIMEIIQYDDVDIYRSSGLSYNTNSSSKNKKTKKNVTIPEEVDPLIMDMDVTGIINDNHQNTESDSENVGNGSDLEIENKSVGFGDGFIMLSPIVKSKSSDTKRKSITESNRQPIQCSTPGLKRKINTPVKINEEMIDSNMPILPEALLKKLFPEETRNLGKLTPSLRTKLRKKLKKFLKNGYLPGDTQITQDRMEFWLQEISTGRSLSYLEKKNLLGSVSAALHSISDRVSDVAAVSSPSQVMPDKSVPMDDSSEEYNDVEVVTSIPESRRKRNKAMRQKKSLENELRFLQKDKARRLEEFIDLTDGDDTEGLRLRPRTRKRKNVSVANVPREKNVRQKQDVLEVTL